MQRWRVAPAATSVRALWVGSGAGTSLGAAWRSCPLEEELSRGQVLVRSGQAEQGMVSPGRGSEVCWARGWPQENVLWDSARRLPRAAGAAERPAGLLQSSWALGVTREEPGG